MKNPIVIALEEHYFDPEVTKHFKEGGPESRQPEHIMHVLCTGPDPTAEGHGRFYVYYPHIEGLTAGCCLDVHSKVMVVDDRMLRIGSANLCNRSMGMDTECDVVIESRGELPAALPHGHCTGRWRCRR